MDFTLSEAVTARDKRLVKQLDTRSKHVSQATITCEELSTARDEFTLTIAGVKLRNVEMLSKSDPYLEICKSVQVRHMVCMWVFTVDTSTPALAQ
jgi:hypothetical protein